MGDGAKGYNGWANYETWCVHLWLTNEQGSYCYWSDEAAVHRGEARDHKNVKAGIWSVEEAARFTLADAMKESFEQSHPFRGEHLANAKDPDVFCELLDSALSEVRWSEIADAFLEEVEPDDEPDDETEADDQADEADADDGEECTAEEFEKLTRERTETASGSLFELGQTVSTPGALAALTRDDIETALRRHAAGDWGDMPEGERQENDAAVRAFP